ncbi:MAG: HD domain-containing protein [Gemmatimonadota bacterium]
MVDSSVAALLDALAFAADKHRDQRRKGAGRPPFINHSIDVAEILARAGGVSDPVTLQAAVLHDTLEDTDTRATELRDRFGAEVAAIVEEVTDDILLPQDERRRSQVECAPRLSTKARLVRLADKIANVRAVAWTPPVDWSRERRLDYLEWTRLVIAGCRGVDPTLERIFDERLEEALRIVREEGHR